MTTSQNTQCEIASHALTPQGLGFAATRLSTLRRQLRPHVRGVRTDAFTGY